MEDQNQYHVLFSNYEKKVQARKELTVESTGKCIIKGLPCPNLGSL